MSFTNSISAILSPTSPSVRPSQALVRPVLSGKLLYMPALSPMEFRRRVSLQISSNTALLSLLGVTYGGDVISTFGPPSGRE